MLMEHFLIKHWSEVGDVAQLAKHVLNVHEVMGLISSTRRNNDKQTLMEVPGI